LITPIATKVDPKEMGELIEISKPAQSQEDLKKFEELKRMKTQKKNEKKKKDKP